MLGNAYWEQNDLADALKSFRRASDVLGKAHTMNPHNNSATLNLSYAKNNIGHVLEARGDFLGAQNEYEGRLKLQQSLVATAPNNADWQSNLAWAWDSLGKLAVERGQLGQALEDYHLEHQIKSKLASSATQDRTAQESSLISNAILGRTLAWCGATEAGLRYSEQAVAQAKALLAFDSTNTGWREEFALYSQQASGLLRQLGHLDEAASADEQAVQTLEALLTKDPISSDFLLELSQAQLENARLQLAKGRIVDAQAAVRSAQANIHKLRIKSPDDRSSLLLDAQARLLLGRIAEQGHDAANAQVAWTQARALLEPALRAGDDPNFLAAYVEALWGSDQMDAARPVITKLNAMGYRTPDFVALLASRHIDYPVDAAFQQQLAQIMQGDAARP